MHLLWKFNQKSFLVKIFLILRKIIIVWIGTNNLLTYKNISFLNIYLGQINRTCATRTTAISHPLTAIVITYNHYIILMDVVYRYYIARVLFSEHVVVKWWWTENGEIARHRPIKYLCCSMLYNNGILYIGVKPMGTITKKMQKKKGENAFSRTSTTCIYVFIVPMPCYDIM